MSNREKQSSTFHRSEDLFKETMKKKKIHDALF